MAGKQGNYAGGIKGRGEMDELIEKAILEVVKEHLSEFKKLKDRWGANFKRMEATINRIEEDLRSTKQAADGIELAVDEISDRLAESPLFAGERLPALPQAKRPRKKKPMATDEV